MKYYIGIDSSTSCTGIAVIDENGELIHYDYAYTKDKVKKAQSLGEEFDIIIKEYNNMIGTMISKTKWLLQCPWNNNDEIYCSIEANSFGGYNTTMLLGITVGIMHSLIINLPNYKGIKYSAVGNWRSKILGTDPEADLSNQAKRNELKIAIMDWAEKEFNIKLPHFQNQYDGIIVHNGDQHWYDTRINDVSDAIGLAYCCKEELLSDRKQLKIETKKANNLIRSLKGGFSSYKKKTEEWFKRWKKSKSKTDLKTLQQHLRTTETYYERLQKGGNQTTLMDNWMSGKRIEMLNKINESGKE